MPLLMLHFWSIHSSCVMTDASDIAVGAVLQQFVYGNWHPLAFFSRALKPNEVKYSAYDCELLAIYLAVKHFDTLPQR